MRDTVPPSTEIEKRIDELLASGMAAGEPKGPLLELAQLGAKLTIQRAVVEGFDALTGRARYERKPAPPPQAQRLPSAPPAGRRPGDRVRAAKLREVAEP